MEPSSDGMFDPGISFSPMRQPPLIKQLKGILSEYPDGGQILKELIQNAEDAEATEINILYDARQINHTSATNENYNRFFRGPALCVANNAIFTEKDWDGIRMIYSSVKEDDPLKVGRFGLGFKSVFHITDYPCVISGSKILMIDPQQPSNQINAMVNLSRIGTLEKHGLNAEAFWEAFDGAFGIKPGIVANGYYEGTLFWFPLRQYCSEVSETLYDEEKVMDLFEGLQLEASSILLFLRNLESINIYTRRNENPISEIVKIELHDTNGSVRKNRFEFKEKVKKLNSAYQEKDIWNDVQISINILKNGKSNISKWMVVNYYVGSSSNLNFQKLIHDENFCYSPYVGVAAPLESKKRTFEGHVFAFLPLPKEGSRLTGLPVHVNGFFALSQNRHHLKLETEEQRDKRIDDKSILWNKYLICEAIPLAYQILVNSLIQRSIGCENVSDSIHHVYACLPDSSKTHKTWAKLEYTLFRNIKTQPFLYSGNVNTWIRLNDACFATLRNLPFEHQHVKDAIKHCLTSVGKKYVDIPKGLFETLRIYYPQVQDLTPEVLTTYLHKNNGYRKITCENKMDILEYILSESQYELVHGLELLPLSSGEWTNFNKSEATVYICSKDILRILPGFQHILLKNKSSLRSTLVCQIEGLCCSGASQIKEMNASTIISFLKDILKTELGASTTLRLTGSNKLTIQWLHDVWEFFIMKGNISISTGLSIVPVLKQGSWKSPKVIHLAKLTDLLLLRSKDGFPEEVYSCFHLLGVTILESLPPWIPQDIIHQYCLSPSHKNVISLLSRISKGQTVYQSVTAFNNSCSLNEKRAFMKMLVKCQFEMSENVKLFTKELKIFEAVNYIDGKRKAASLTETPTFINGKESFPTSVMLPFTCLQVNVSLESFVAKLGGRKISVEYIVEEYLKIANQRLEENNKEFNLFIKYLITNFHYFKNSSKIVRLAKNLRFLKTGPNSRSYIASELFDPSEKVIEDLLYGECLLPDSTYTKDTEAVHILKILGLKGIQDIDCMLLYSVATTLNDLNRKCQRKNNKDLLRKAKAFMNIISRKPSLLEDACRNGFSLGESIYSFACIPVEKRVPGYPPCITWFKSNDTLCKPSDAKDISLSLLVGGIMPIIECTSEPFAGVFGWKDPPAISNIFEQLKIVRNCYSVHYRSDVMPIIKSIYDHLSKRQEEVRKLKDDLAVEYIIWTGEDFVTPERVIVEKQKADIDLHPHYYYLPEEYMCIQHLFISLGCLPKQDICTLQNTIKCINSCNEKVESKVIMNRDKRIVVDILEKIASLVLDGFVSVGDLEILMMVHDTCYPSGFTLRPASECTYDDDPTLFCVDNGDSYLVHEMIPVKTATALGVKSISRKAALDAEELGVEKWGQQEHLTTRIHALLRDGYTDGLSVPKELIQNADDAGATTVRFLYDERQNRELRERVLCKGMKDFQGPALWVYNDAVFSDDDLKNITKLNAATKQTDVQKIGKFGLGFCSVYNLTDLPSFITGSNIVFFDPHEKYLGSVRGTGLKYTLPNATLVLRHSDQFKPYNGVFGCEIGDKDFKSYNGTLFRLPLRTEEQARESKIYSVSYTNEEMIKLLRMLILTAGNMLLFSQNVTTIEVFHLDEKSTNASKPELLFNIHKSVFQIAHSLFKPLSVSVLSRMIQIKARNFIEMHKTVIHYITTKKCKALIDNLANMDENFEIVWLLSWARGNSRSLKMSQKLFSEGAVPLAAVAIPCADQTDGTPIAIQNVGAGFYSEGHIFCFLPLPIKTKLQFHVNGCFAVTSDRRQLVTITEDDKSSNRNDWNNAVQEDALVIAFIKLLEKLSEKEMNVNKTYKYYTLWPSNCSDVLLHFKDEFYKHIVASKCKIFEGNGSWVNFHDSVFLDPKFRQKSCGATAFEFLKHIIPRKDKTVIEMPEYIFENIKKSNVDKIELLRSAVIGEKDFFQIFFKNIDNTFWKNRFEERNNMITLALKIQDKHIDSIMKQIECIPTSPQQRLRRPSDLIHPYESLSKLFSVADERFPYDITMFRNEIALKNLIRLGMNYKVMPNAFLIDRCVSVTTLAHVCCSCARERCTSVIDYLSNAKVLTSLYNDLEALQFVQSSCIMPVLQRPKTWTFSWGADKTTKNDLVHLYGAKHCINHKDAKPLLLGQSGELVRQRLCDYVGSVKFLVDESFFSIAKARQNDVRRFLQIMNVKDLDDLDPRLLVEQILLIVREYKDTSIQFDEFKRIHNNVFQHFNSVIKSDPENVPECLIELRDVPVIPIETVLVKAENVALNLKEECVPSLYRLPVFANIKWIHICKYLGVKDYFDISFIINAIDSLKDNWINNSSNVEKIRVLLVNLKESIEMSKTEYDSLNEYHDRILAPDTLCQLWPTYDLAAENIDFRTNTEIKILHRDIPISLGESLGVKTKELKCFESMSIAVSFGQREKLVTRIKGLLKAYPCDESIMKELLQNADDARATEIHFVKDYREHSTKRLFSKSCASLQGPALCVFNNSYFTKEDFEGIHNLGQGSKGEDPTKTGQYGVGFNSVYHLTDTPSFITKSSAGDNNDYLITFDPLLSCLPKATITEPGQMCKLSDVQANFPDQLLGFSQNQLMKGEMGTIFRFPLRRTPSDIQGEVIDTAKMDSILNRFKKEINISVLFLKNVRSLKISKINTNGELIEEYSVNVEISDESMKEKGAFNDYVHTVVKKNINNKEKNLDEDISRVIYPMTVNDSFGGKNKYLIIQQFGHQGTTSRTKEMKVPFSNGDLGLIPIGGVALPLNSILNVTDAKKQKAEVEKSPGTSTFGNIFKWMHFLNTKSSANSQSLFLSNEVKDAGKAFCFLPLPVETGLPVHVNGHFALDHESRRDLWKDGFRMEWNRYILEHIIIPSWICGILKIQNDVTKILKTQHAWYKVNDVLQKYHMFLPLHDNSPSRIWRDVISQFYLQIANQKVDLFPCVFDCQNDNFQQQDTSGSSNRFQLTWTHVSSESELYMGGYFNDIFNYLSKYSISSDTQNRTNMVGEFLKNIGMKLIETPNSIMNEMQIAGVKDIPVSSPKTTILFLNRTCCDIGPVNVDVTVSKFRTKQNLLTFVKFICQDDCFADKLSGLPVLLTQDNKLRRFSEDHKVFITDFATLLPRSSSHFMNLMLIPIFSNVKIFESNVVKKFSFNDFTTMLPDTMQKSLYAAGLETQLQSETIDNPNAISQEWLFLLYEFLCDQSRKEFKNNSMDAQTKIEIDMKKFLTNLRQLNDWSFLPCVQQKTHRALIPIHKLPYLLHLTYIQKQEKIGNGLGKLNLPTIDLSVFDKSRNEAIIKSILKQCVPSLESPSDILDCLVYHKEKIRTFKELIKGESTEILAYFGRKHTLICKDKDPYVVAQKLRELPLFLTMQGTLTSIDIGYDIIVIPRGMPFVGVQEWADNCSITLLQENDLLHELYDFLQLRKADIEIVYNEMVLPNFTAMPKQYWISHITFLRDRLSMDIPEKPVRAQIIQQLTLIAFINVDGTMKRVNQLYDIENEVFRCMKSHNDFPPDNYQSDQWRYFFKQLGLICVVTDEMMIQFASNIEFESTFRSSSDLCEKSNTLLQTFLTNKGRIWQTGTLYRIKSIKFILSHSVEKHKLDIFPQFNGNGQIICFEESVSSLHSDLCWTSCYILPSNVFNKLAKSVRRTLQIYEQPELSKVILHCQNICDVLKPQLRSSSLCGGEFIKDQMTCFYEYFDKQIGSFETIRSRLENKPFVHLPEDRDLVLLREVITNLPTDLEIKPYLYSAPKYYGRYHGMFEKLGSKQHIMFSHYAYVMQKIKDRCKDSEMNPAERNIARKAIRELLQHNHDKDNSINEVNSIYLPNEDLILQRSNEIVVSDNIWFQNRLQGHVSINLFAGNQFLDIEETSEKMRDMFTNWPAHLKPLFLTDLFEEIVYLPDDANQSYLRSSKTLVLENFFHSPELLSALGGILNVQFSIKGATFNDSLVMDAGSKLQSVKCYEIPSLKTVLRYNDEVVSGSDIAIPYHIKVNKSVIPQEITFFVSNDAEDVTDISHILDGLIKLIRMCVEQLRWSSMIYVMPLLQNITTPEKIPDLLQRLKIQPHFLENLKRRDYFPKPGTYVEPRFIPFLEQGIQPFESYEFNCVAMEIDYAKFDFDRDDPNYIYVKILNECPASNLLLGDLGRMYTVLTGNPDIYSEQVPIYRLYRFVRREEDPGQEIQQFDAEPINSKPFDEHCRFIRQQLIEAWKLPPADRKRVIRRLLFKWHPDKNPEQRDYSKRVFQYIQVVISRLENGEYLTDDAENEMTRGPSEFAPSTSRYYSNLNESARAYARAYHDNYDDYCCSYNTGRFSHSVSQQVVRPDVAEAERWLRQAKNDFRAAQAMLQIADGVEGFNWICYLCHQSCEKALKSARYFKDANNVPRRSYSHRLTFLMSEPAMLEQAQLLESRLGDHARLRYPDTVSRPRIPSDIFQREDAEFSIEVACKMITIVEEYIS
ncbi:sacsin-like [Ruditapes philippinarum]|uniref:sacsin-like n=1 Tax=Ruditapes philippinarum TaxID=129788 RepID=UPI00295A5824|nr:sacsin-like [Ruditapes philippinarum]